MPSPRSMRGAFTLIELLVVIAIIAVLAVVVVITLNPAQLLAQSRDANRVSDMATLDSAVNLYLADQSGASSFFFGSTTVEYVSAPDPSASTTAGDACQGLGMPTSAYTYHCAATTTFRNASPYGWLPINFQNISSGSPFGSLPVDPVNQTSTGLYYAYTTAAGQFQLIAIMESQKYMAAISSPLGFGVDVHGSNIGSGPVGWWPLNEATGTVANDASGNGNTGNWSGSQTNGSYYTTNAAFGRSAGMFNGVNAFVNVATTSAALSFNGPITMSAWFYPTSSINYDNIMWGGNGASRIYSMYLMINNPSAIYVSLGGTNIGSVNLTTPWALNAWNFVALTANGSTMNIYLNGALVTTYPTALLPTAGVNQFQIGNNGYYFPGMIQDVRVYARALSGPEIQAIYNEAK